MKKTNNHDYEVCDKIKIKNFLDELEYQYGAFINFIVDGESGVKKLEFFPKNKFNW